MPRRITVLILVSTGVLQVACETASRRTGDAHSGPGALVEGSPSGGPPPNIPPPGPDDPIPSDYPGLHNVVAYAPGLLSGSVPEGDAGFDTLVAMGVRTIISVDGAQPDLARAKARGLRYVHLPISYNGVPSDRRLELSRAARELPGPIYLHCHHGRHRSAGALGVVTVTLGLTTPEQAIERMKVSGTSPSYTGLYRCVSQATVASERELQSASGAFPESWKTSGLVKVMVEIDEVYELLRRIEKAGWKTPPDHPDLVPAAEAGRLADLFRNLRDDERVLARPPAFLEWMMSAAREAQDLENGLVAGLSATELSARYAIITKSCKDCHVAYRD